MMKRPDGTYYVSSRTVPFQSERVVVRWEWRVYVARDHASDRWVCVASSEKTARQIAKALNQVQG